MPPRPLSIYKAQASYVPLSTASTALTPRTPFSAASTTSNARPLLQSPFPAVLTTEEWEEEREDGKLVFVPVVAPRRCRQPQAQPDRMRWAKIGLAVVVALGVAGWGVSAWVVAYKQEGGEW